MTFPSRLPALCDACFPCGSEETRLDGEGSLPSSGLAVAEKPREGNLHSPPGLPPAAGQNPCSFTLSHTRASVSLSLGLGANKLSATLPLAQGLGSPGQSRKQVYKLRCRMDVFFPPLPLRGWIQGRVSWGPSRTGPGTLPRQAPCRGSAPHPPRRQPRARFPVSHGNGPY